MAQESSRRFWSLCGTARPGSQKTAIFMLRNARHSACAKWRLVGMRPGGTEFCAPRVASVCNISPPSPPTPLVIFRVTQEGYSIPCSVGVWLSSCLFLNLCSRYDAPLMYWLYKFSAGKIHWPNCFWVPDFSFCFNFVYLRFLLFSVLCLWYINTVLPFAFFSIPFIHFLFVYFLSFTLISLFLVIVFPSLWLMSRFICLLILSHWGTYK